MAILLFTVGFLSAYLLIYSGVNLIAQERGEIVAGNLLREQWELTKNARDTNWVALRTWDSIAPYVDASETNKSFSGGGYFTIEGVSDTVPLRIRRLPSTFSGTQSEVLADRSAGTLGVTLCMDADGRYTHTCGAGVPRTSYASYFRVEPLVTRAMTGSTATDVSVADAYRLTYYVAGTDRGYHTYSMSTMLTNWKK